MPPDPFEISPEDRTRIERMLTSIGDIASFTRESSRAALDADARTRRAPLHALIDVGEAAARPSDAAKTRLPEVPWQRIIHIWNVLIHVYWGVNLERVWEAATLHAPESAGRLRQLPARTQGPT